MILSISLITPKKSIKIDFNEIENYKTILNFSENSANEWVSFDIEIVFKNPISKFRNHDYTWVNTNKDCIAATYSPKIIELDTGFFVQPNLNIGVWEVRKSNPKKLLWRFNPKNGKPLTVYGKGNYEKTLHSSQSILKIPKQLELLFSNKNAIEFSRSQIPFSAIACFTDHCDFDTVENVIMQREFFKQNNIKVTKGFFLNHFSKRADNAAVENDKEEFKKWIDDGHELAYHSLSQSIKSNEDSTADFLNFTPPFDNLSTWIDHGYQPYNFSLYQNSSITEKSFSNTLKQKDISILWNYIDSGTSTNGVLNQLNTNDFTLASFYKGINSLPIKDRMGILIKNIMFHYYADEKLILKYKATASHFKELVVEKNLKVFFKLISSFITLSIPLGRVFLFWNYHKNKPYKLAQYSPLLFKHTIADNDFYVFQTLEMIDFKTSLAPNNIEKLISESGVFIAHTYFSVPMSYHIGKMFKTANEIDEIVAKNFNYLGSKIANKQIWNPTINQLVHFLSNFENTILDVDADGTIIVTNSSGLPYRNAE